MSISLVISSKFAGVAGDLRLFSVFALL